MLNLNMNIIIWSQLFEYYSNIELFTHLGFFKCSEINLKEIDFSSSEIVLHFQLSPFKFWDHCVY